MPTHNTTHMHTRSHRNTTQPHTPKYPLPSSTPICSLISLTLLKKREFSGETQRPLASERARDAKDQYCLDSASV